MSEFIERSSEVDNLGIEELISCGYIKIDFDNETYLYDPIHWSYILDENQIYDYMFDNLMFKSLTSNARELAISEGYGENSL